MTSTIRVIRIDIPLSRPGMVQYFFIYPEEEFSYGPWWGEFYRYLLALFPAEPEWITNAVQEMQLARRPLSASETADLVAFMNTAPALYREGYRPLRRALERLGVEGATTRLCFFRKPSS